MAGSVCAHSENSNMLKCSYEVDTVLNQFLTIVLGGGSGGGRLRTTRILLLLAPPTLVVYPDFA